MLQDAQRTSAPSAVSVSISTPVWIVMCSEPAMRAPLSALFGPYSSRVAIRPGISISAMVSSLRPHSARPMSFTTYSLATAMKLSLLAGNAGHRRRPARSRVAIAGPKTRRNADIKISLYGRSRLGRRSVLFAEAAGNQRVDGLNRGSGLPASGFDRDGRAGGSTQHHQPHDGGAANRFAAPRYASGGIETFDCLTELRRCSCVKTLLVDDLQHANNGIRSIAAFRQIAVEILGSAHFPASTRLAMVTYFRPAACAAATASSSVHSALIVASFAIIGTLVPASTSALRRPMQEIARLGGVPPNMSVRMATPSPVSTRFTASTMSRRRCSTSSSGPMVTASIWL